MAGNFLISNKNVPSVFKKLELQRHWSGLGASIPENFGNLEAWKWYFQCSLKELNLDMV